MEVAEPGAVVTARRDDDPLDLRRHRVEVEADPVLAALGRGRLPQKLHAPPAGDRVVVEAEVGVVPDLAVPVEQKHGDIGVALARVTAPGQAHHHRPGVLAQLRQADVGTLDHLVHEAPQMHGRIGRTRQPLV